MLFRKHKISPKIKDIVRILFYRFDTQSFYSMYSITLESKDDTKVTRLYVKSHNSINLINSLIKSYSAYYKKEYRLTEILKIEKTKRHIYPFTKIKTLEQKKLLKNN